MPEGAATRAATQASRHQKVKPLRRVVKKCSDVFIELNICNKIEAGKKCREGDSSKESVRIPKIKKGLEGFPDS